MSNTRVDRIRTPASIADWTDAVTWAWRQLLPYEPTIEALSVLWSQYALETGRGSACFQHNLGNIKRVPGDGYDYTVLRTFEYINGQRVDMDDTFRAYATLRDGALDYVRFLTRASYAEPWSRVVAGDADAFARELKRRNYYTAPVDEYARGLKSLSSEYLRAVPELPPRADDDPTWPGSPSGKAKSSDRLRALSDVPIEVPNAADFVRTLADTEPAPPPETEPAA